uniref:Uncharacterized protein n=1 Tax=Heterorhabditis bacteriophora TaxID=37862 RepID=A0A1I7WWV9_HETBA
MYIFWIAKIINVRLKYKRVQKINKVYTCNIRAYKSICWIYKFYFIFNYPIYFSEVHIFRTQAEQLSNYASVYSAGFDSTSGDLFYFLLAIRNRSLKE